MLKDDILGKLNKGWPVVKKVIQNAAIAKCVEMVGGGQRALEMAKRVGYNDSLVECRCSLGRRGSMKLYCTSYISKLLSNTVGRVRERATISGVRILFK